MRATWSLVFGLLTLAQPALAAPSLPRSEWERFVQPAPMQESALGAWLGRAPTREPDGPDHHFLIRHRQPFAGGIDVYAGADGRVGQAIFYLAAGPLYLKSQIHHAHSLKTPFTLSQVERIYGKPAAREASDHAGCRSIVYAVGGDPHRTLVFSALPGTDYLYRVVAERD